VLFSEDGRDEEARRRREAAGDGLLCK